MAKKYSYSYLYAAVANCFLGRDLCGASVGELPNNISYVSSGRLQAVVYHFAVQPVCPSFMMSSSFFLSLTVAVTRI